MAEGEQTTGKQEKPTADMLLSKYIGDAHYRAFKIKEYFDVLNDVVHYYLEKFGPYLDPDARKDLAILALDADKLYVDISELIYEVQSLRGHAQAHIDTETEEDFSVPEESAEELNRAIEDMEETVANFSERLTRFIEQLLETVRREGVA